MSTDGTSTEQEPHLDKGMCSKWPKAGREQIKRAFGKTLEHTDCPRGRIQHLEPHQSRINLALNPPRPTIRITQNDSRLIPR